VSVRSSQSFRIGLGARTAPRMPVARSERHPGLMEGPPAGFPPLPPSSHALGHFGARRSGCGDRSTSMASTGPLLAKDRVRAGVAASAHLRIPLGPATARHRARFDTRSARGDPGADLGSKRPLEEEREQRPIGSAPTVARPAPNTQVQRG